MSTSSTNSWLRAQRKSELIEIAENTGYKKYVSNFILFFFLALELPPTVHHRHLVFARLFPSSPAARVATSTGVHRHAPALIAPVNTQSHPQILSGIMLTICQLRWPEKG